MTGTRRAGSTTYITPDEPAQIGAWGETPAHRHYAQIRSCRVSRLVPVGPTDVNGWL